jgi:hypothetical protein
MNYLAQSFMKFVAKLACDLTSEAHALPPCLSRTLLFLIFHDWDMGLKYEYERIK